MKVNSMGLHGKLAHQYPHITTASDINPIVYVVIPVFNRRHFTYACLKQLEKQTYTKVEVVVVDDGSSDGTSQMIDQKFPSVTLIKGDGRLWWLGAINLALQHIMTKSNESDLVIFLNDDLIFKESLIEVLVRTHKKYPRAIIGSVESIQGTNNLIHNGGNIINWWVAKGKNLNAGRSLQEFPAGHTEKVSIQNGRGVLFPMKVIREIGLLNTRYVHLGDFEFSVRAEKHGYELLKTYDAVVYHYSNNPKGISQSAYKWSDLHAYLTDERSYANIRNVFLNSILCTKNPLQAISYFFFDTIRIMGHFIKGIYITKP